MQKCLIIGACGYLGSVLFNYLKNINELEVHTIDLEWFGNQINSKYHKKLYYSYLTKEYLKQFDTIVLTAAHSSVKMVDSDYNGAFINNVWNFIQLLGKLEPEQKFIYCSSASVYSGIGDNLSEDCKSYIPLSAYDVLKVEIDYHAILSDKQFYGLRLGTIAGYSPNLRIDTVVNSFYNSYRANGCINVFNGEARRGILCTQDFCRAIMKIIENGDFSKRGLYNLCSFNTSINSLGNKVSKILNCPINYLNDSNKYYNFTLNNSKMILNFDFAFQSTIESIIQNLDDAWFDMKKGRRDNVPGHSK